MEVEAVAHGGHHNIQNTPQSFSLLMQFPGGDPWSGEAVLLFIWPTRGRPEREGEGKPSTRRQTEKKKRSRRKTYLKGLGVGARYLLKAKGIRPSRENTKKEMKSNQMKSFSGKDGINQTNL